LAAPETVVLISPSGAIAGYFFRISAATTVTTTRMRKIAPPIKYALDIMYALDMVPRRR